MEKLVYGGDALARDNGQVILTPFLLPGESARVRVVEQKSQLLKARVEEVLVPSAHRVTPRCPHFGPCGGCHYQHAAYEYQLEQKLAILREVFSRVGKMEAPGEIEVLSGPPFGYRNRAQFHFDGRNIGYHEAGSRNVLAVEDCPISSPKLLQAFAAIRRMSADTRFPRFLRTLELFTNETDVQLNVLSSAQPVAKRFFEWSAREIPGLLSGAITYAAAGFEFRVSHDAFFQVNRFLIDTLVEAALRDAEGESALDLYSGVGLFSLPLAKRFQKVTAVESGAAAWRDLKFNAERAGVALDAQQASAEHFLAANQASIDFVLADPPRAGLGKHAVQRLLEAKPRRLTIVSCDPATLARDLAALCGAYSLDSLTMIDLFPQTFHLETVARLRLASA
ncbi:MAG: class I SAM-dependent RNA methyltransferase [Bryobacterales bacterium]|nr:class I SAM-dependent RNA methyltransferase [Bryobacterales bacterium]